MEICQHDLFNEGMPSEVKVKSDSDPLKTYVVNTKAMTCTCPSFVKGHKLCKHLLKIIPEAIHIAPPPPKSTTIPSKGKETQIAWFEKFGRTRLSKNFILRDFLYSSEAVVVGLASSQIEDPAMVIRAGKQLCEQVLEPVLANFGRFAITFGYQTRAMIDAYNPGCKPHSSSPHQWDRGTFGDEVYARVDILPFCVEDGEVGRHDFAKALMYNLDIDLIMQWWHSNVYCITISPKPRRVWLEWFPKGKGNNGSNTKVYMGEHFWQKTYPTLAPALRPKFAPSMTGGSMRWT